MRYTRSLRSVGKVFASSRPPIINQYRPRNLQIFVRLNSTSARSTRTGTLHPNYTRQFANKIADLEMETVDTTSRLTRLRELMKEHKVDIYSM